MCFEIAKVSKNPTKVITIASKNKFYILFMVIFGRKGYG